MSLNQGLGTESRQSEHSRGEPDFRSPASCVEDCRLAVSLIVHYLTKQVGAQQKLLQPLESLQLSSSSAAPLSGGIIREDRCQTQKVEITNVTPKLTAVP